MRGQPFFIAAAFLVALISGPASAQEVTVPPRVPESPELLEEGKQVYFQRCAFCHGLKGAGDGPVADYLDPRPRDFRDGLFKFRSTKSGQLPKDEDLFRTIARGLPGTAMPAWQVPKKTLSDEEVWQVLHYLKTLIDPAKGLGPKDEDNDPYLDEYQLDLSKPPYPTGDEAIRNRAASGGVIRVQQDERLAPMRVLHEPIRNVRGMDAPAHMAAGHLQRVVADHGGGVLVGGQLFTRLQEPRVVNVELGAASQRRIW